MNSLQQLEITLASYLTKTWNIEWPNHSISFELNTDEQRQTFGHASWNAALAIAKKAKQSPRAIAEQIIKECSHIEGIERIEIAGPGFLNFFFTATFFNKLAVEISNQNKHFFIIDTSEKRNYSIEFVSANPTGPLHFGHGRGGIIGDVLARILRFIGHHVTTEFYINDAGSQIAKLGSSLKIRCQQAAGHDIHLPEDAYHGEYLKDAAQACIKEYGTDVINQPESFFAHFGKERLLTNIQKTLADYQISFDVWFSEKTLHDEGDVAAALDLLIAKEYAYWSENALWFKATEFSDDKDRVLKKSNGEYTYLAADVAYLNNKIARGFDQVIMILGQDHHSYAVRMKALMAALHQRENDINVILYQLVTLKEDEEVVRMSKRTGKIVSLQDIIDTVGVDVARFFYLNRKADAHLEFDIAKALKRTEENPVFYIQYAYVRARSIIEKATLHSELQNISSTDCLITTDADKLVLLKIAALRSLLASIAHNHQTHLLAYYTLELAQAFHHYYRFNRVIDLENSAVSRQRIAIVHIIKNTLHTCLELMGLSAPDHM